jgi:hypothetical protein
VGVPRERVPVAGAVEVPHCEDMSDATFCRHMNLRHEDEMGGASLEWKGSMSAGTRTTLDAYRRFHERLHEIATPGFHDHVHEEATPSG